MSKVIERWKKKTTITENGCWLFNGAKRNGYGWVTYKRKQMSISRAILIEITAKNFGNPLIFACHKCNNKNCFNPEHLYWGSRLDNVKDMIIDKKHNWHLYPKKGENHPKAKFTNEEVKLIRYLNKTYGYGPTYFYKKYGYNKNSVNNILYNKKRFKGV